MIKNKFKTFLVISLPGLFLNSCQPPTPFSNSCDILCVSDTEYWNSFNTKARLNFNVKLSPCYVRICEKVFGKSIADLIIDNNNDILFVSKDLGNSTNKKAYINNTATGLYLNKFDSSGNLIENTKNTLNEEALDFKFLNINKDNTIGSLKNKNNQYYLYLIDKDKNIKVPDYQFGSFTDTNIINYKDNYYYEYRVARDKNNELVNTINKVSILTGISSKIIEIPLSDYIMFPNAGENDSLDLYKIKEKNNTFFIDIMKYNLDGKVLEPTVEIDTGIVDFKSYQIKNISINKIDGSKSEILLYLRQVSSTNQNTSSLNEEDHVLYGVYEKNKSSTTFNKIFDEDTASLQLLSNNEFISYNYIVEANTQLSEKFRKSKVFIQKFNKDGKALTSKLNINPDQSEAGIINYQIKEIKNLQKYILVYEYVVSSEKIIQVKNDENQLKDASVKTYEHKISAKILNSNFEVEKKFEP